MVPQHITVIALIAAVAAGGAAWYTGTVARQITSMTLADGRRQERRLPLLFRLLLPFAPNFKRFFDVPAFKAVLERHRRTIIASGYGGLLQPYEILALRLLMPLVLGFGLSVLFYFTLVQIPGGLAALLLERQLVFYVLFGALSVVYPGLWLNQALRVRHASIERALPFVLDLLTLSVEAGVDFMTGIRRIIERREVDPLGEELVRVFRQIQIGKTRREALSDMAERVDNPDIYSVTNALIQADDLGSSIGTALRIQADQMRTRRYQRAEKLANEAPVKMLFPLIAFIFPAVFIVLLGPILMELLQQGF
jgi:tight adherence protein C